MQEEKKFKLSEEDLDLIVDRVSKRIEDNLYHNVGKGVMQIALKGLIIGLIMVAAYGVGVKHWFG